MHNPLEFQPFRGIGRLQGQQGVSQRPRKGQLFRADGNVRQIVHGNLSDVRAVGEL